MATLKVVEEPGEQYQFGKPPPHNIDAEQMVLGAMMLSNRAVKQARQVLDGDQFYRPAHRSIWEAICALADRGDPSEPVAVATELGPRVLNRVGGGPYLHTLIEGVVSTQVGYYAHLVAHLAHVRQVVQTGTRLIQLGHHAADVLAEDLHGAVAAEVAQLTQVSARGWQDPTPLEAARQLPSFPVWALPDWLGEYAARLAEQTQTPPDLAGCLGLAVLAVAAGGKVWVQARGWREPTNLFIVVALGPANRKSEVFAGMTGPVRAVEKELAAATEPVIDDIARRRRIAEADLERAEKVAANAFDRSVREQHLVDAAATAQRLEELQVPIMPRLYSDDATPEMLTSLLAKHGGRMAVLSPEGEIFNIASGRRYRTAPNFAVLKHGHAGEGMRVDRIGRAAEHIDAAHVTLGICPQPDVLAALADVPEFRGQGLLGRILYAVPDSLLGWRDPEPDLIPDHIADRYTAWLKQLILDLCESDPISVSLEGQTTFELLQLQRQVEPRFRPGNDLAYMPDWGGKFVGAVVRIAGLLHIGRHHRGGWSRPITAATFADACQLGDYFTAHAQAAYDLIGADPVLADARILHDWLARTGTHRFGARDAVQALRHRFKKHSDLDPGLRVLESHGWIRRLPTPPRNGGPGRTPASVYEVHPGTHNATFRAVPGGRS